MSACVRSQPKKIENIIHCCDCVLHGDNRCPMYYEEMVYDENDGIDIIFHDNTEPYGYCYLGEMVPSA